MGSVVQCCEMLFSEHSRLPTLQAFAQFWSMLSLTTLGNSISDAVFIRRPSTK
jgi:hypothetical protein